MTGRLKKVRLGAEREESQTCRTKSDWALREKKVERKADWVGRKKADSVRRK